MATVRHRVKSRNALMARLEAGNAKVAGMRLLLPVEDRLLVPVEVVGITFGSGYRGGMLLKVAPVGGVGEYAAEATALVDDTPATRELYLRKSLAKDAYEEYQRGRSDRERRDWILRQREKMTAVQRKRFDATAGDHFGNGADMVKGVTKSQGEYDLRRLAERAIQHAFDLDDGTDVESD